MTAKLLSPFRQDRIPVIGFVNECNRPEEVERILRLWKEAAADLGNHTCSHPNLDTTPVAEYERDILKGESVTTSVLGHRPKYFRYPFLHTGENAAVRQRVASFLSKHGSYRNAPVTPDNDDYIFARVYASTLARNDLAQAARLQKAYLDYMEAIFAFFERWSEEVTGSPIRQILLIHASQLNADAMPNLLEMMRLRGYEFVTLHRALADPAYSLPEAYVGPRGLSWVHRWAQSKGMKLKSEPQVPSVGTTSL